MQTAILFKTWLVWGALATSVLAFVVAGTYEQARDAWTRARPFSRFVFIVGVAGITLYGGSKGVGGISFPFTDPETKYLTDAGSYVSNDCVRVAFTVAAGVPNSAPLLIDRRLLSSESDADWTSYTNTTIGAFGQPKILDVPHATNWNWVVYTTWTPGSAVQTNGVWHCYWGLDKKARGLFIPARSCIRVDGEIIATPQSKWNAEAEAEEGEEDDD